ncbi:hypothetical protein Purlil1_12691 [Purpureocillium lilacinum]|uniref:Uncharacterized protein n=1 Tax=Purpureocillium lilacinum TaxID=33203 RepID=A0ABR0BGS5_PURLI|nr:hypothetical protein Purlil1_12691 [Purpureocillium lilacinum]
MRSISRLCCGLRSRVLPGTRSAAPVDIEQVAENVLTILLQAEEPGGKLTRDLENAVSSTRWTGSLAYSVLRTLETTLRECHVKMGPAMVRSYNDAVAAAKDEFGLLCELALDCPSQEPAAVLTTVIALGVLMRLAPATVDLLGFGPFGPQEGQSCFVQSCGDEF